MIYKRNVTFKTANLADYLGNVGTKEDGHVGDYRSRRDLEKNVFQVQGPRSRPGGSAREIASGAGSGFFSQLPSCVVGMEACGGAHFWGREIGKLGHEVRLVPPAYVKPFVKRQKNDAANAEAICEAATRSTRRFLTVKSDDAKSG